MDGIYNTLPDQTTKTEVLTIDAPKEIMDINHHLVNYILDMDGKGQGVHDTINAGVTNFTGWKSFDSPHMQELLNWVGWVIQGYLKSVPEFIPVFSQVWGMGYEVNDVTPAHSHEPA